MKLINDGRNKLYVVISQDKIKTDEVMAPQSSENSDAHGTRSSVEISISNESKNVNSLDEKSSMKRKSDIEKQNEALKKDVARLRELVKIQGIETNGTLFADTSVNNAASRLQVGYFRKNIESYRLFFDTIAPVRPFFIK